MDQFIRLALAVDREIHREYFWQAVSLLDGMRTLVVEMFARARGGGRPYRVFQADAPRSLHEQLAATLPQPTFPSLQRALFDLIALVEREHRLLGKEQGISASQETIFHEMRRRRGSAP